MARKNQEANNSSVNVKSRSPRSYDPSANLSLSPKKGGGRIHSPPTAATNGSSPRHSPGLLAGHYAGCKWAEPPLPSALPRPPPHWMCGPAVVAMPRPCQEPQQTAPSIEHQLKVLLNVRA